MLYGERLSDLDELILRCRDKQAKQYITEAVDCYRVGAFRSCIVATWVALVFDFLHKLHELELTGDSKARQDLANFERIHKDGDLKASLEFERDILKLAKEEYELISDQEYADLERLHHDRNRCAHPSMNSSEDIYQPSAELARYHLRNAVIHFLQHPPVQGKAALDKLMQDIASEYFPKTIEGAIKSFSVGSLGRPREALIRNFVTVLLKQLILNDISEAEFERHIIALEAVRHMHRLFVEKVLDEKLNSLMQRLHDSQVSRALRFLVEIRDAWQYLKTDITNKLNNYVINMPARDSTPGIDNALNLSELKESAVSRIDSLSCEELCSVVKYKPRPEYVDKALQVYVDSNDWGQANSRTSLVTSLVEFLQECHIEQILRARMTKWAIKNSFSFKYIIYELEDSGRMSKEAIDEMRQRIKQEEEREIEDEVENEELVKPPEV